MEETLVAVISLTQYGKRNTPRRISAARGNTTPHGGPGDRHGAARRNVAVAKKAEDVVVAACLVTISLNIISLRRAS